jgi:AcrR family transcriptional regulator
MRLDLPPRFSFADFKKVTPIDGSNVLSMALERQLHRMTVKRAAAASENLPKIFDATFRLANKKGFEAMSLRDLCKETGLSMGGLYGYITSKDDLAAVIEDVVRHSSNEIPLWFSEIDDPFEKFDATLRAHVFVSELLQPWFFFVFMESRLLSATQRSVAKASEYHFQNALAALLGGGDPEDEPRAQLAASHCMALIQDWYVKRWKYRHQKVSVDSFANSISEIAGQLPRMMR